MRHNSMGWITIIKIIGGFIGSFALGYAMGNIYPSNYLQELENIFEEIPESNLGSFGGNEDHYTEQ